MPACVLLNPNNVQRPRKHDGMEYGQNREINNEERVIYFVRLMAGRWVDFAYQNDKLILKEII